MAKRVISSVWNFYEKDDDPNYAMCLVSGCKTKIKQSCGNTCSDLWKHLKAQHINEHQEIKATTEKQNKKKEIVTILFLNHNTKLLFEQS